MPEGETLSREYLANERTLLSWIRTGINAISVGILLDTVVRVLTPFPDVSSFRGLSDAQLSEESFTTFGLAMVVFGALVEVVAVARFVQYKRSIHRGGFTPSSLVYLLVAMGLAIFGVAYIIYVLVV